MNDVLIQVIKSVLYAVTLLIVVKKAMKYSINIDIKINNARDDKKRPQ